MLNINLNNKVRNWQRNLSITTASLSLSLCGISSSQAGIIWIFVETDLGAGNFTTTATASGSFSITLSSIDDDNDDFAFASIDSLITYSGDYSSAWDVGVATETGLASSAAVSHTGTFGHEFSDLYWAGVGVDLIAGTDVSTLGSPSVTWNLSMVDLFGTNPAFDSAGDTLLAWTLTAGGAAPDDTITYLHTYSTPIPEPSSVLLCGLGSLALLVRRKK